MLLSILELIVIAFVPVLSQIGYIWEITGGILAFSALVFFVMVKFGCWHKPLWRQKETGKNLAG